MTFVFILIVAWATGLTGDWILSKTHVQWRSMKERFILGASLGLGIWMLTLFLVGMTVGFSAEIAMAHLGLFCATAFLHVGRWSNDVLPKTSAWVGTPSFWMALLYVGSMGMLALLGSRAPVAEMSDALTYHLNLPKEWMRMGYVGTVPFDLNSSFPLLMSAGYGYGLLLGSDTFANLLNLYVTALAAALIYAWTRRSTTRFSALLASMIFLWIPAIYNHMHAPYVDIPLALFTCLAVFCFCLWTEQEKRELLVLTGVFAGFALGTKLLALLYVPLLVLAPIWHGWRKDKTIAKGVNAATCVLFWALVVGSMWYLRSAWVIGNPFYPYATDQFGGPATMESWGGYLLGLGIGYGPLDFLSFFWQATFAPEAFAGFGTRWNVLLLGLLPLVLWDRIKNGWDWMTFFAVAVLIEWFWTAQVMRFLFPFLLLYAVLLGRALDRAAAFPRAWRVALTGLVLLVGLGETASFAVHEWPMAKVGLEQRDRGDFLASKERSFSIALWANKNLPGQARILCSGEGRLFYFKHPVMRDDIMRLFTDYNNKITSGDGIVEKIRRDGFTHVLISDFKMKDRRQTKRGGRLAVRPLDEIVQREDDFTLLHTQDFLDRSENQFQYRLYAVEPAV